MVSILYPRQQRQFLGGFSGQLLITTGDLGSTRKWQERRTASHMKNNHPWNRASKLSTSKNKRRTTRSRPTSRSQAPQPSLKRRNSVRLALGHYPDNHNRFAPHFTHKGLRLHKIRNKNHLALKKRSPAVPRSLESPLHNSNRAPLMVEGSRLDPNSMILPLGINREEIG